MAVDIETGEPVNLSALGSDKVVKYVRVYSAVLDVAQFGETSTEVTGIFTATGTSGSAATTDLEVWGAKKITTSNKGMVSVSARSYTIYSAEDHVYVNGVAVDASGDDGYTFSIASGEKVQIITQSGTESPYVTVLNCA